MKPKAALVIGATGALGFQIVQCLRSGGIAVRASMRIETSGARAALEALGAEPVVCDLLCPETLRAACEGVDVVVSSATAIRSARSSAELEAVDRDGQLALVAAAGRAGASRFVFISFAPVPVDYALQRAKRAVEAALASSDLDVCILRPAKFVETWLSPAFGFDPRACDVLLFGSGEHPVSWVSRLDVARHAATAALEPGGVPRMMSVAAPRRLSLGEATRVAEAALGSTVRRSFVSEQSLAHELQERTTPRSEALAAGRIALARGQCVEDEPAHLYPLVMPDVAAYLSRLFSARTPLAGAQP